MRLVYTDILFYSILVYLIENDLRRGRHVVFNLHVQLLVNYPPKVAISSLVNSLKGVSSRLIRKKQYPSISKQLWGSALWSPSYFAGSCGGAPVEIIRQYIEQQNTPH
ncbi:MULTISPECIES: IS200/IS605 family transposase [unclassified Psychrobacter]|jgi:putative transposase|uniref:IS200/IS605 family transposase n=1 Tax=Psychrobacter sp. TB20-MNA-CIBAN-0197 TaxID=3140453 RepID=UPI000471A700|nr:MULTISPECIES: IS200/IS605 family transposase [unclassified Psychrobacter]|tara:strand:- start:127 stop:450 length:324 start_codon:yes stop_codon:yes gene_type:complete